MASTLHPEMTENLESFTTDLLDLDKAMLVAKGEYQNQGCYGQQLVMSLPVSAEVIQRVFVGAKIMVKVC